MDEDCAASACVRGLAGYLRANPQACDTAEGIRRWWFDSEHEVEMEQLQDALDWMKRRGAIEEILAADGRRRYRRLADDALLASLARAGRSG
ncbi:hypothetical protein [Pseudomonas sp. CGJS7]|uniref:hypothetical protein n=1 Tax=Pseudomonas sp. CGJS7 TaxID=3109348 RepID=UPI00300AC15D